jgi:hypothetical protein
MTTVVIGNPITKLRVVLEQIFQGINNLLYDKEVSIKDPRARGVDQYNDIKEPKKYIQKGGIKQMCDEKPYETEHAYGLTYNYEEEKVAPSFSGPQFQVYLDRATELCDEDPNCNFFNLWTDGGMTKYKDCAKLKDTKNSTLTYEKIPNPPVPGEPCEDRGFKMYDWYDYQKGNVSPDSGGAGEAKAEWDENGKCVRVSCNDPEKKELSLLKKCIPAKVQQLSLAEQIDDMWVKREQNNLAKSQQKKIDAVKEYYKMCTDDNFNQIRWCNGQKCPGQETVTWHPPGGKKYTIPTDWKSVSACQEAAEDHVERTFTEYRYQDDGLDEDWSQMDRDDPFASESWW